MTDFGFGRKGLSALLIVMVVLLVSACGVDNHYELLQKEGKRVDASVIEYHDGTDNGLDYADDSRTLADTSDLSDDDEIEIPSKSLKDAVSSQYDLETPIRFEDVKDIQRLQLNGGGIESIAGIEYFESLSQLDLSYNPRLTSIKGVEALENLTRLDISNTMVKQVEYDMPALERFAMRRTWVDMDESNIESLAEKLPALKTLDLTQTRFRINEDVLSTWESVRETSSAILRVDYKQVDYRTVGFDAFWEFDDEGYQGMNPGIDVEVTLKEGDNKANGDLESLYVDITDETYHETLAGTLDDVKAAIGVDEVGETLDTIILVYDYLGESIEVSEEGSTSVLDAYDGEPVTKATAHEAMALMYQHLGLPVYSSQISYATFNDTDEFSASIHTLDVIHEEGIHAIGSFEYFLVGSDTLETYVIEAFEDEGYEGDGSDITSSLPRRYSEHDFKRDTLSESADHLNIDMIFE